MPARPTPHVYSYNRELSSFGYSSTAAAESSRSLRASSEVAVDRMTTTSVDRTSNARALRAASAAPEPGTGLAGYTGYYGRQLALLKESQEAKRASAASSSAAASSSVAAASAAASSASTAVSASRTTSSVKKSVETTMESRQSLQQKKVAFASAQESSLKEGRNSVSRAVRRAEYHAQTSGKDPRHVGVPRDTSDDICKKVADIHMSPYEGREIGEARAASSQSKLKMERMEKELASITSSAMKYRSLYTKSAAQMAMEAMSAVEEESKSKKVKKTVVEETRRVAAA